MIAEERETRQRESLVVAPKRSLIKSGVLLLVIVPLPLFAVLVFQGLANGSWAFGVAGELIAILLCAAAYLRFRGTSVEVTYRSITERGFFGPRTTALISTIDSIAIAHTYSSSTAETLPQLIARDRNGARVLRLRGVFWTEESMLAVAQASGLNFTVIAKPLTSAEFFARFPGSAYWFENRKGLVIAGAIVAAIACVGLVLGLMGALGVPISG